MKQWMGDDLDQPMLIITAARGDARAGCLVGFATQCSIRPLRYIVFISKKNHTYRIACDVDTLGVHAVPGDRIDLARLFGSETGDETDKFERAPWFAGPEGVPLITGCPKWFVGRIIDRVDVGDHVGFLLSPMAGDSVQGRDLGFQSARSIPPGHDA